MTTCRLIFNAQIVVSFDLKDVKNFPLLLRKVDFQELCIYTAISASQISFCLDSVPFALSLYLICVKVFFVFLFILCFFLLYSTFVWKVSHDDIIILLEVYISFKCKKCE